ncbi:RimJ/RimL family protein N-acetyltransferase [Roseimicrobium gellanilyticum]|uniref:RimJ/RimL family protein N-acetyltransferase n=1 Tax=Roseimicrobium gellanilyticum TaxID=748857 RepID=A0A366HUF8_9BACT|nr:GNAT family N-acetyltransferase [Roseimicrobium gellanilyticum]RBP47921.1 RimJ/RimL family protein N-acetyltransferase [Roseimicrobium gellanilyticum]
MNTSPRDTLTDGVITLHRYRHEDVEDVFAGASESIAEIHPWMPWCHPGYGIHETQGWVSFAVSQWDAGRQFEFVIRTVAGQQLGSGGINSLHDAHPFANLGYWIRTSQTNKGYATRATRLLAEFAFRDLRLQRVEIVAATGNLPSQRVAEKAGAAWEGILRNRLVIQDTPHDAVMFSFTPSDFEK